MRQGVKIKNPDELFLFLSDNKKMNDLECLIEDDNINLDNIKNKVSNLIEKKKNNNKNIFNNNSNDVLKKNK